MTVIKEVKLEPVPLATANRHAPATNTQAQITYAAVQSKSHVIEAVVWSYDDAPTGGNLQVHDGAGHVFMEIDITSAGPGYILFTPEKTDLGQPLVVTLAAGGAGISGVINVIGHKVID